MNGIIYSFKPINSWSLPSSGLRPPSPPISGEKGQDFIVDKCVIVDFDYDVSHFTMASLPTPQGTMAEDRRIDPPQIYEFAK